MKTKFLITILSFCAFLSYGDYYNHNDNREYDKLPDTVTIDGKKIYNPSKEDYFNAGWRVLYSSVPSRYFYASTTNYVDITNKYGKVVTQKNSDFLPITVSKPEIVVQAEQQYLSCWNAFFSSTNPNGYTNAVESEVLGQVAIIAEQNQSLYALTHVMKTSFDIINRWWNQARGEDLFHPYPWGLTNNIVIKDVIYE